MLKKLGLLISLLLVVITACAPAPTKIRVAINTPTFVIPKIEDAATIGKCTYLLKAPTPTLRGSSLFAPVITKEEHVFGPEDAYLTIVIYSDYQCPVCAQFAAALKEIQHKHPQDIRVVHRNFPLRDIDDKSFISAQAAEAANLQGKFWEMHDLLFAKQAEWVKLDQSKFAAWATAQAAGLGLDVARFSKDLTSPEMVSVVQHSWEVGSKIPLPGVPFLLVNGEILKWQPTLLNNFENIINLNLLPKKQFDRCPPAVIDPAKQYTATLKTVRGEMVIRLFADKVPNTVNNFVFLARNGWYDHLTFQRVVAGFIAQAGDPTSTGQGNPGYFIPDEIVPTLKYDRPGMVGMFNTGPNTNGSQFFITYTSAAKLNGRYTLFGELIKGLDVLNHLTPRDALPGQTLPDGDALYSIIIEEK